MGRQKCILWDMLGVVTRNRWCGGWGRRTESKPTTCWIKRIKEKVDEVCAGMLQFACPGLHVPCCGCMLALNCLPAIPLSNLLVLSVGLPLYLSECKSNYFVLPSLSHVIFYFQAIYF
jgi:hypothetical protein